MRKSHSIFMNQVQDYGLCLKSGATHSKRFLKMKVCLLKLFLMSGSNQYGRALCCDLLVYTHQQQVNHPIHKLMQADPHCFNEESGEISLSCLARLNLGMTDKRSLSVMEERFRMTKASLLIAHYLNPRMRKRLVPVRTKKFHIDPVGTEVQTTINFFVNLIAGLIAYCYQEKKPSLNLTQQQTDLLPVVI